MAKIFLLHWNETEAKERGLALRSEGHDVLLHWSTESGPPLKDALPDIAVISLDRLPSHGRAVAEWLSEAKKRQHIPIIFAGGEPSKIDATRKKFPKALYCSTAAVIEEVAKLDRPRSSTASPAASRPSKALQATSRARRAKRATAQGKSAPMLPETMIIGKASRAKAADGDKPVFAYIASLPQPQRGIAERVDALAAKTLPDLRRSVKWGMSYYGVGDGWCFCCGGFAKHVKLMFVNGVTLTPVPPVIPVAMGKSTRGVELESVKDLDERQIAAWMKQVAAVPGVGGKKR